MATSTLVPLSEYLHTMYRPDCDWVDGELRERNMGEGSHSTVQMFFIVFFHTRQEEWGIRVKQEHRVQVSATRYRIPDVYVRRKSSGFEEIARVPPLLCIEVLSPEDRMSEIRERIEDYFKMGVEAAWVVDPLRRLAFSAVRGGDLQPEAETLVVNGTPIRVPVSAIFEALDDEMNDGTM